jgi:hypothetical protein
VAQKRPRPTDVLGTPITPGTVVTWGGLTKNGSYFAFGVVVSLVGTLPSFYAHGQRPALWAVVVDEWARGWRHQAKGRSVGIWEVQRLRMPLTAHTVAIPGLDREELERRFPPGSLHSSEIADGVNYAAKEWEDDDLHA